MKNKLVLQSASLDDTGKIAISLAKVLPQNIVITLDGDLGLGKTTFVASLVRALGIEDEVSSPTFAIMQAYANDALYVRHLDLYRLDNVCDFQAIGLEEDWQDDGITLLEWSELLPEILPDSYIAIKISKGDDETDKIDFLAMHRKGEVIQITEDKGLRHFEFKGYGSGAEFMQEWMRDEDFPGELIEERE